jgi:hypothetical protein
MDILREIVPLVLKKFPKLKRNGRGKRVFSNTGNTSTEVTIEYKYGRVVEIRYETIKLLTHYDCEKNVMYYNIASLSVDYDGPNLTITHKKMWDEITKIEYTIDYSTDELTSYKDNRGNYWTTKFGFPFPFDSYGKVIDKFIPFFTDLYTLGPGYDKHFIYLDKEVFESIDKRNELAELTDLGF